MLGGVLGVSEQEEESDSKMLKSGLSLASVELKMASEVMEGFFCFFEVMQMKMTHSKDSIRIPPKADEMIMMMNQSEEVLGICPSLSTCTGDEVTGSGINTC